MKTAYTANSWRFFLPRVSLGKPAIQNGYQFLEVDKVLDEVPCCIPTKPRLNWLCLQGRRLIEGQKL